MNREKMDLILETVAHYVKGNINFTKAYAFNGNVDKTVLFIKTDADAVVTADYHEEDGYVWIGFHDGKTERSKIILGNYFRPVNA